MSYNINPFYWIKKEEQILHLECQATLFSAQQT